MSIHNLLGCLTSDYHLLSLMLSTTPLIKLCHICRGEVALIIQPTQQVNGKTHRVAYAGLCHSQSYVLLSFTSTPTIVDGGRTERLRRGRGGG
ncbi:MAG: hypothetical protein ACYC4A_05780 [Desulfobulbia bacterium]